VFFGAPHRGIDIKDMKMYLAAVFSKESTGEARKTLVNELRKGNPAVERELQDFKDLVGQLNLLVVSVYECQPARRLVPKNQLSTTPKDRNGSLDALRSKDSEDAMDTPVTWVREGKTYTPLKKEDALLGFPYSMEVQIASDNDHSNMTKFNDKDHVYRRVVEELGKFSDKGLERTLHMDSNATDALTSKLSQLCTSMKFVLDKLSERAIIQGGLNPDVVTLQRALTETLVLLGLAEEVLCRAIMTKSESQLDYVATALERECPPLECGLHVLQSQLDSEIDFRSSLTALGVQQILPNSLDFNMRIQHVLLDGLPGASPARPRLSHSRESMDRLTSLRCGKIPLHSDRPASVPELVWIPFEKLDFSPLELEEGHQDEPWLGKFIAFFTKLSFEDIKLKPKRLASLQIGDTSEKVLVEFCPCPGSEVSYRREQFLTTIRTIIQTNDNNTLDISIVPIRGVSSIQDSHSAYFIIIFKADNLINLSEAFQGYAIPSVKCRVWLALRYAQFIATLHSACLCHGLINPFSLYLQLPPTSLPQCSSPKRLQVEATSPMLAGFDVSRPIIGTSDLIDVEDPLSRVHLHPERKQPGYDKSRQEPRHDVFSLGMVLTKIGHWALFSQFTKYGKAASEDAREAFCQKLRKAFDASGRDGKMPDHYRDIISYCLGRSYSLPGESVNSRQSELLRRLDEPKASRVVEALAGLYENLS
jgi:hypothetical protein